MTALKKRAAGWLRDVVLGTLLFFVVVAVVIITTKAAQFVYQMF